MLDNSGANDPNVDRVDERRRRRRDRRRRDDDDNGGGRKGTGPSIAKVLNPPFDPRILQIGPPGHRKLQRGFMVMADPEYAPGGTNTRHRINFLFNPQTVDVSHALNPHIVTENNRPRADMTTGLGPPLNFGQTHLSLLFDRTYELWDSSKRRTRAGRLGVYADVLAFYIYTGICSPEVEDAPAGGGQAGGVTYPGGIPEGLTGGGARDEVRQIWVSMYPNSWMHYVPSYFYIGDKLKFYGRPISLAVQYTHWTLDMVPSRCVVSMDISLDQDPNQGKRLSLGAAKTGMSPVGAQENANNERDRRRGQPNIPNPSPGP